MILETKEEQLGICYRGFIRRIIVLKILNHMVIQGFSLFRVFYYFFISCGVARFLSSPVLKMVVPPIVGIYYGALDIWGEDWEVINNYRDVHEIVFGILATSTIVVVIFNGISEKIKSMIDEKFVSLQKSMVEYCNGLVKLKSRTVRKRAKHLKPKGDPFKLVVLPEEQLERSIEDIQRLLVNGFSVDARNIGITVIAYNNDTRKWKYKFKNSQTRQHTSAEKIMNSKSTAQYCYNKGESLFVPDIRKGAKEEVFRESDRSAETRVGSIFCKPVNIVVNNVKFVYIFTVAVYGEFLCTPYSAEECHACTDVLDEIADRIEMELHLLSVKSYRENGGFFNE